RTSRS
ncbi:unnamed protein product, partial [Allacma fusca]